MLTNPLHRYTPADTLCPCGKSPRSEIERVPRGFVVKMLLFWLPVKRYKCYRCRRKRLVLG